MLSRIAVENYALIESLDMQLGEHLNIITGQTGAGKSILLGALGLILGNRADVDMLFDKGRNCVVEGQFDISGYGLEQFFEDSDLDYSDEIQVRRVITPSGKSRAYVNDLPVQLSLLKDLGMRLIDIHSQHQSLLVGDEDFRIRMVDGAACDAELTSEYAKHYISLKSAERELYEMKQEAEQRKKDEDYMRYQYEQLFSVKLHKGELEELEAEQRELSNVERIKEVLEGSIQRFNEEDVGVLVTLKNMAVSLSRVEDVYSLAEELAGRIESAEIELKDVAAELEAASDRMTADPKRLEEVDSRLDTIYGLLQKHRVATVDELLDIQSEYEKNLQFISDSDERIVGLERKVENEREVTEECAGRLSQVRKDAAHKLEQGVMNLLGRLGMGNARFCCSVRSAGKLTRSGGDEITFMFSSSKDGELRPLEKTASGGEISRVMLCLKALVAQSIKLPTIIFDEIDTGVSGRIADETGEIIAELSNSMQVINITHLPQVASKGDTHFLVYKDSRTHIKLLDEQERVEEIANMLSGSKVTEAAREHAKELLGL